MKRALVLSLGLLLAVGFATFAQGELTGSWDTTITIAPGETMIENFFDFESNLEITYSVGGWSFTSTTGIDDTGWAWQDFAIAGAFGAFDVSGGMIVSPLGDDAAYPEWVWLDTGFTFGAVNIGIDFDLYASDIRLCLEASATTGLVDITGVLCFGDLYIHPYYGYPMDKTVGYPYYPYFVAPADKGDNDECDLDWSGVSITVDFPFCCADVSATLAMDCDGFDEICFEVDGIVVANIPWFTLGAELCFTLESKTLVLSPEFDFGADVCFDVYIHADDDDVTAPLAVLTLPDIKIVGLGIECEIGGVSFSGLSWWDPDESLDDYDKPGLLYGEPYWEAYRIATTEDACCGPFDFDITMFFDVDSTFLFDIAAFEANFSYELGANFIFSMGLDYTALDGLTEWTIGFEITW
jgi:hypothetical protein